jgi:hypothetical protein
MWARRQSAANEVRSADKSTTEELDLPRTLSQKTVISAQPRKYGTMDYRQDSDGASSLNEQDAGGSASVQASDVKDTTASQASTRIGSQDDGMLSGEKQPLLSDHVNTRRSAIHQSQGTCPTCARPTHAARADPCRQHIRDLHDLICLPCDVYHAWIECVECLRSLTGCRSEEAALRRYNQGV